MSTSHRRFTRLRSAIRTTAKWGGLILSILFLVAWAVSTRWSIGYMAPFRLGVGIDDGSVNVGWLEDVSWNYIRGYGKVSVDRRVPNVGWGFWNDGGCVGVPFWFLVPPTIALTAFAWRRRRVLPNHCPACNYDRAGLLTPDAVCPECGAAAPKAVPATERTARPMR